MDGKQNVDQIQGDVGQEVGKNRELFQSLHISFEKFYHVQVQKYNGIRIWFILPVVNSLGTISFLFYAAKSRSSLSQVEHSSHTKPPSIEMDGYKEGKQENKS